MKTTVSLSYSLILTSLLLISCSTKPPSSFIPTLAIVHATVIDVTGTAPEPDMTVVIEQQRVAVVGPSRRVSLPANTPALDVTGKFLIPGLVDSHVHLTAAGEPTGSRKFVIPLLVANGITTVRDMGGQVDLLKQLRSEIQAGQLLGPQIFFTGPYLDGDPPNFQPTIVVKTSDQARKAVDQLVSEGVDFLKVQSVLSRDAYFAIAAEAKRKGIRFVGHVPDRVSAFEVPHRRTSFCLSFTAVHTKLGNVVTASRQRFNLNVNTSGFQVQLAYSTKFTGGDADEQFVWSQNGDKLQLLGYHINSMALIVK